MDKETNGEVRHSFRVHEANELEEGDFCPCCDGTMGYEPVVNCYCHLAPPCSNCVENPLICLDCGWGPEAENV